jgi:hypothetical protein
MTTCVRGLISPRMSRAEQWVTVETAVSEAILRSARDGHVVVLTVRSESSHQRFLSRRVDDSYEDFSPTYSGWM